jgi:hypothetical protein
MPSEPGHEPLQFPTMDFCWHTRCPEPSLCFRRRALRDLFGAGHLLARWDVDMKYSFMCTMIFVSLVALPASSTSSATATGCPDRSAGSVTIPFTLLGDHIYTDAMVNDTGPYRFLVDTGGVNLIDTRLIKTLSLKITQTETGHGVGEATVKSSETTLDRLILGDATFRAEKFHTFEMQQLYASGGVEMAGMIGASLFRQYVTCIDFNHHVIDLINPPDFDPSAAGAVLPMTVKNSEITVHGSFDGFAGRFQIDTGSPTTVTLNSPFVEQHKLLIRFPQHLEASVSGVGGSISSYAVRGKNLELGSVRIDHPISVFTAGSKGQFARHDLSGNIGLGALKRWVVTFNFPGQQLYLKPYRPEPPDLDTYDRSGLRLEVTSDGFRVASVARGTPAAEARMQPGDVIVAVDRAPANSITLPTMRDELRQRPAGSSVILDVKTDGKVRHVNLKLRNLL